jgi:cell surface protein SprA
MEMGSYTVSTFTLPTTFGRFITDTSAANYLYSQSYKDFENNRLSIANRLATADPRYAGQRDSLGYPVGYGNKSGQVLLPAFYAAYSNTPTDQAAIGFRALRFPLPNWRISYNGLSRQRWARKYFQSFTLNHSYRSTYTVSNYATNLLYNPTDPTNIDLSGNYYTPYQISQVTISEQFSPLIGVDMTLKNSLTARFEYKQDRTMNLSLVNARFTDMRNKEMVLGIGYRMNGSKLPLLINGRRLKNDLDMRFDFSIRDNITILRDIDGEEAIVSAGLRSVSIKPNINYKVNDKITVRLFFDRLMNNPRTGASFRTVNTQGGFSIRFNLAN